MFSISGPIYEEEHKCSKIVKSKGFTTLMKLVMQTSEKPLIINDIKKYLEQNPSEINKQNEKKVGLH